MDVINEEGVIYVTSRRQSFEVDTKGLWVPIGNRPFYYTKVVWLDSLKFVFGCWDKPGGKLEAMIEVSTGGIAASKDDGISNPTIDNLILQYRQKLLMHNAKCGEEVVENFKSRFIQLWQIKLWAL